MSDLKIMKSGNEEQEPDQVEISIEDLGVVRGTGEFDEVPKTKEGDYDPETQNQS